ncbi:NCS2 family permease [Acetomicrobium sp. S15 = DSM 107314]|uniref:NCS2 family permease n=1 Tax=Acetomicrobium sp. S15 = DSM 107314 TaxID=2529858 RepID=UPI0018E0D469|nr:NCS2 family permease [Acetomicrobium sp. S15 = DSM 107314]
MGEWLDRRFEISERKSSLRTEIIAGITTFMTMAYIIFVNPAILSETGMDFGAVMTATCLASAIGTLIMGLYANYPFALAPGMGLNAFFAFTVVIGMKISWQTALAAVFLDGILFILLTASRVREAIVNAVPYNLKLAVSAGIGLFIALIGLVGAGIVVDNPATLVSLGDLTKPAPILSLCGLLLMAVLHAYKVKGALLWGILAVTLAAIPLGVASPPQGIISTPPSLSPILFKFDLKGLMNVAMIGVVITFLFVDLFDTLGTLIGVSARAGFLDKDGNLPRANKALTADAVATAVGACLGTSTVTTYVESASGVEEGGRTGLASCVVALLFLGALFFSPIARIVPAAATSPALIMVGVFMMQALKGLNFDDITEMVPAAIAIFTMPFTYSIAEGIAWGIISYTLIKLLTGRGRQVSLTMSILTALFLAKEFLL